MRKTLLIAILCFSFFASKNLSAQTLFEEYNYSGTIGSYPISLTFLVPDHHYNYIQGSYYYTKYKKRIQFRGKDGEFEGRVKLTEYNDGAKTGYFIFNNIDGIEFPGTLVGEWHSIDGKKSYDVTLRKRR